MSVWIQPTVVALILIFAALFSTGYHSSDESDFLTQDLIASAVAGVLVLIMFILMLKDYPIWHWRPALPLILGVTGAAIFVSHGSVKEFVDPNTVEDWEMYHSIWHVFTTLATFFVVLTKVDFNRLGNETLASIIYQGYERSVAEWKGKGKKSPKKSKSEGMFSIFYQK